MNILKILLISMTPISELRGAIPIALGVYQMSVWLVYPVAVIGNLIPVAILLPVLKYICPRWLYNHTEQRHNHKFVRWGDLALIAFVAIPLPFTGAWTGALAAFVFNIPFRRAFPLITIGVLIAGIIVTLLTLGIINL